MATIIQIKKPATLASVTAPTTTDLAASEPAMVFGSALQDNGGGRLYIGNHNDTAVHVIGGYYFTGMLDQVHGTLTASKALIANSVGAMDTLRVGTSSSAAGSMRFLEGTGTGTNYITLQGTASVGTSRTLTLPAVDGNVITSGDTGSVAAAMIADEAVTFQKIEDVAANSLLVNDSGTAGVLSELAVADTGIMIGNGAGFTAAVLSGDVTMTNGGVVAIGADKVTYPKMQNLTTANRVLGSASTGLIGEVQVATDMIATAAVTVVEMQNVGGNSLLVRNAANSGVMSALAVADTKIMIGANAGFGAFALSGDVTMTNGGAVSIGAQKVTNAMLADDAVGADELASNAVVNASVAAGAAIAMNKTAFVDGAGLTLTTNTLAVDADQSGQITAVGNLTVGSGGVAASISSDGAYDLIMQTNAGSSSGLITITDGVDGDITISPNGSGTVDVDTHRIVGVTDPTGAQDAATKSYVDAVKTGLDVKGSVRVATAAVLPNSPTYAQATGIITAGSNVSINTAGIDGVTDLAVNDRVLVKTQAETRQNGIYYVSVVGTASGSPVPWTLTRATDADSPAELTGGTFTFCEEGSGNSESGYVFTHNGTPTLTHATLSNNTPLTVAQFSGAGQITAGTGLTKDGNTINAIGTANRISVAADAINIHTGYVGQTSLTTLGTITTGSWTATDVGVAHGGTGVSTLTSNGILYGNGTGAVQATAAGTDTYFMYSNSGTPAWTNTINGGTF